MRAEPAIAIVTRRFLSDYVFNDSQLWKLQSAHVGFYI